MSRKKSYADSVQATIDHVKRGGDQPSWWSFGTVIAGALFFCIFAWQVMSSDPAANEPPPSASPSTSQSADPSSSPTPDVTPSTSPTPDPSGDATVSIPSTVSGTKVKVSAAALAVATEALHGLYDIDAAARVPMANGEQFPVPAATLVGVQFGTMRAQSAGSDSVTFVASADPDGSGPSAEVTHPFTVVRDNGTWALTLQ